MGPRCSLANICAPSRAKTPLELASGTQTRRFRGQRAGWPSVRGPTDPARGCQRFALGQEALMTPSPLPAGIQGLGFPPPRIPAARSLLRRSLLLTQISPRSSMRARPSHSCDIRAAPGRRNKIPGPGATRKKSPTTTSTTPTDSHAIRLARVRWTCCVRR
jgi:hypothetical protein